MSRLHTLMRNMSFLVLVGTTFPCDWQSHAAAATFNGHSFVSAYATGSCWGDPSNPSCPPQFNVRSFSSELFGDAITTGSLYGEGTLNGFQTLSASASVTPDFPSLLHVITAASSTGGNGWIRANSAAIAGWRDVIFVAGGSPPSELRISFAISGELLVGLTSPGDPWAYGYSAVGVNVGSARSWDWGPETPSNRVGMDIYAPVTIEYVTTPNKTEIFFRGFDGASFNPLQSAVSPCVFHYDAQFNPSLGGYDFFVDLEALTGGGNGFGVSHFVHSLSVNAVTLTDGTPLADAGLSFAFDSGLTLGAAGDATIGISVQGDFDKDGDVDGRDFLAWQRGDSPAPLSSADLADWQANYGNDVFAAMSIPEPAAFTLALLIALAYLPARRPTRAQRLAPDV